MEEVFEKKHILFAAVNKTILDSIPSPKESEGRGKNFITWGDNDDYPNFLYSLYENCPTLGTIINTTADYVTGDGVHSNLAGWKYPNYKLETWEELIQKLASDYLNFGICYIQVIRNHKGGICEFYHLDSRYVRSDEDNEQFYFCKDFGKKYTRANKMLIYPKFVADAITVPSSVICIKTPQSRGVYGFPIWNQAIKAVMAETKIDEFHLSELDNNFTASAVINFNNGTPSEEEMDNIEQNIYEKFTGSKNAGRFVLSFNNGVDNATTIERLSTDDFNDRYENLAKKTQSQIFTSFGASPVIFGVQTENNGFNDQDYKEAFKLYNKTKVKPIQMRLIDGFDKALGVVGSLTIDPFDINWNENKENEIVN